MKSAPNAGKTQNNNQSKHTICSNKQSHKAKELDINVLKYKAGGKIIRKKINDKTKGYMMKIVSIDQSNV